MSEMRHRNRVLWIEDDPRPWYDQIMTLEDHGFDVEIASTVDQALERLNREPGSFDVILLDVIMKHGDVFDASETHGGYRTGVSVARLIRGKYPRLPIIGVSISRDPEVEGWFDSFGAGYITKPFVMEELLERVQVATESRPRLALHSKVLVVYRCDQQALLDVRNLLHQILKFGEVIVLQQEGWPGRTIIDQLEDEAHNADMVIVLLTPDDLAMEISATEDEEKRPRQNVLFELGYFFGRLQQKTERVILLYKGELPLPADLPGMSYVDITEGVQAAEEKIRREISEWI